MKCPRCKKEMSSYPAISRRDNKTEICTECGTAEALFDLQVRAEKAWLDESQKL